MALFQPEASAASRVPIAGFLAWLVPGLGHLYLGERGRGLVFLVTVTATFWTGVAIGGVNGTVNPHERRLWFMAQICNGGSTLAAYGLRQRVPARAAPAGDALEVPHWLSVEVGVHYTGVAGLLNLLVILDAIVRADPTRLTRRAEDRAAADTP